MKRILTALILVPSITYLVVWARREAFIAALVVIGAFAFREYARIAEGHGFPVNPWLGSLIGLAMLAAPPGDHNVFLIVLIAAFGAMMAALRQDDLKQALPSASALILGVCYIFGSWWCALRLRDIDPWLLMFALALNWVGDTAAMYVGKAIGRHKLAPVVSPGKTWEGALASALAAVVFGFVLFHYVPPRLPWWGILALAIAGNVVGQMGDLSESAMKRGANMKDSGSSLPGHGGWLDRIDSSLFAVPAVYVSYLVLSRF